MHLDDSIVATQAPLMLLCAWKIEANQASVVLQYSLNPALQKESLAFNNVVIIVSIEGAKANSCLSKPVGTFSREKSLLYWKLDEITVDSKTPAKLIARFATDQEARPGPVEARWEISGAATAGLGSGLGLSHELGVHAAPTSGHAEADPFADESSSGSGAASTWKDVPTVRKLISGKYTAS